MLEHTEQTDQTGRTEEKDETDEPQPQVQAGETELDLRKREMALLDKETAYL